MHSDVQLTFFTLRLPSLPLPLLRLLHTRPPRPLVSSRRRLRPPTFILSLPTFSRVHPAAAASLPDKCCPPSPLAVAADAPHVPLPPRFILLLLLLTFLPPHCPHKWLSGFLVIISVCLWTPTYSWPELQLKSELAALICVADGGRDTCQQTAAKQRHTFTPSLHTKVSVCVYVSVCASRLGSWAPERREDEGSSSRGGKRRRCDRI